MVFPGGASKDSELGILGWDLGFRCRFWFVRIFEKFGKCVLVLPGGLAFVELQGVGARMRLGIFKLRV